MKKHWKIGLFGSLILTPMAFAAVVAPPAELIYLPQRDGLVEVRDVGFELIDSFVVEGVQSAVSGAVFNDRGNLVMLTRFDDRVQVLETTTAGEIVNQFNTGRGSLLLGSFIDFHVPTQQYIFANDDRLTLLDSGLNFVGSTDDIFQRASGVGFLPDGSILATDTDIRSILHFDSSLQLLDLIALPGRTNTGFDIGPDGNVYASIFSDDEVVKVNLDTHEREIFLSDLNNVENVTFLSDGTLLTNGDTLNRYTIDGRLLESIPAFDGDATAILIIPEPSSLSLLALAGLLVARRRRTC